MFGVEDPRIEDLFRFYISEMEIIETSATDYWAKFASHVPLREARIIEEKQLRKANIYHEESGCASTASLVELG
jgi:hypothetical protein